MRRFFIVWFGQLVSVVGTGLTMFGLIVWTYLETGSVTALSIVSLLMALPATLLSPVAGAYVDRWDRRITMLVADLAAGAATLTVALLYFNDALALWHVYLLVGVGGVANAFQQPAWLAAIPMIVPKRHLGRANGLVQTNEALSMIAAPAIAGALLATVGLGGILVADGITFVIGVVTLASVRFPAHERTDTAESGRILDDVRLGWRYLRARPGLLYLLWVYAGVNFVLAFANVLFVPMLLAFTTEGTVGTVMTVAGIGMLLGSLAVGAWGGPKHLVRGTMWGIAFSGLAVALAGLRPTLLVIVPGVFLLMLVIPVVNAASQTLWQRKVAPGVQGRVFALRRTFAQIAAPLAIVLTGPLADGVFEPLMAPDGTLAGTVGTLLGVGEGRGIGLMIVLVGLATVALGVLGWMHPRIRNLERDLPDAIADAPADAPVATSVDDARAVPATG
ncbi:MAG: MFS transporter [Acidimicrobiia bacterium]|nr:MFS transporter [Acidimicrobiia bacterium]